MSRIVVPFSDKAQELVATALICQAATTLGKPALTLIGWTHSSSLYKFDYDDADGTYLDTATVTVEEDGGLTVRWWDHFEEVYTKTWNPDQLILSVVE